MKKILFYLALSLATTAVLLPLTSQAAVPPASSLFRIFRPSNPPLNLSFNVTPTSGQAPLSVTLRAQEISSNNGEFNFYFWCNNGTPGTDTSGSDHRVMETTVKTQTYTCTYNTVGTYRPKVVLTMINSSSIESRKTVTVTSPPPSPAGPGGEIIFADGGEPIRIRGSLVADKIIFNVRKKSSQGYAAMIYNDSKILYSALPGFETLTNVMIQ